MNRLPSRFWPLCAIAVLAGASVAISPAADSAPRLQVRLIRASNQPPERSDPRVATLNAVLKADFGYLCYEQLFFSEVQFTRDSRALYMLPEEFGIAITYRGRRKGNREYFVETEYRGKKLLGFYAVFPEHGRPVLIRGPGNRDYRYIIALSPADSTAPKSSP
ncbi:MAG: hypothetical protein HUU04_11860 [Verrucomicrobiae bacterium]|nr:hypothetical protein [Verrucomicrobiae bacterium]